MDIILFGLKMDKLKVIIAGGRDFKGNSNSMKKVSAILSNYPSELIEIVSGGAKGADKWGEDFATHGSLSLKRFPADWKTHGKKAGILRNIEMAEYADALIAFWDRKSRGTGHMIKVAREKGLEVRVIKY